MAVIRVNQGYTILKRLWLLVKNQIRLLYSNLMHSFCHKRTSPNMTNLQLFFLKLDIEKKNAFLCETLRVRVFLRNLVGYYSCHTPVQLSKILSAFGPELTLFCFYSQKASFQTCDHTYIAHKFTSPRRCGTNAFRVQPTSSHSGAHTVARPQH